jgi:tRNA threonylcarbamoyladenosine modification (KEOPS) complex Cgi121 subunit
MALSVVSKCIGAEPDEKVLELSEKKVQRIKLAFGISELELETSTVKDNSEQALVDLVIERVALLSTKL